MPLDPAETTRRFHRLLQRAGLPRIRFHDLRHTTATLLLTNGVHPKVVASLLGHSTVQITLDTYSHVTPTLAREAVARLDALVANSIANSAREPGAGATDEASLSASFCGAEGGTRTLTGLPPAVFEMVQAPLLSTSSAILTTIPHWYPSGQGCSPKGGGCSHGQDPATQDRPV